MNSLSYDRALVLGGGGSTGNAWLIGLLAGLHDSGLDITTADLTVGTSAGATVAAQLASATPPELFANILDAPPVPPRPAAARPMSDHLERFRSIIAASADIEDMRRTMGAIALESDATEQWRGIVAARFGAREWPHRRLLITAVDATTGEPVIFDRDSGIDLVDAVAASTSGGGSVFTIGEGRYIDGGYRSNAENADLASGYARVLVLSPLGGRSLHPVDWGTHLASQVDDLRAQGSTVEMVIPRDSDKGLFGAHAMDASLRPAAARAGHEQGGELADALREFWG
ncbi:patatin-like phospholipase family protein [Glaciihabitans arcticus]|uniref:Patatin-like phospholipase family protein n=1 Tax=Glaciihabitans arcticus TaxID=2668039 RepID=A0A4Q9GTE8_9MICO|nr:patatin-like phospholipase family protein [Glaciihabitans arcticus]TBN58326.1 patatin-like phospholipase family protein [Glaciihabitans arcticus]